MQRCRPTPTLAKGAVVVATWNSEPIFSVAEVEARSDDFAALAADLRPDVLLLDEITSLEVEVPRRRRAGPLWRARPE